MVCCILGEQPLRLHDPLGDHPFNFAYSVTRFSGAGSAQAAGNNPCNSMVPHAAAAVMLALWWHVGAAEYGQAAEEAAPYN